MAWSGLELGAVECALMTRKPGSSEGWAGYPSPKSRGPVVLVHAPTPRVCAPLEEILIPSLERQPASLLIAPARSWIPRRAWLIQVPGRPHCMNSWVDESLVLWESPSREPCSAFVLIIQLPVHLSSFVLPCKNNASPPVTRREVPRFSARSMRHLSMSRAMHAWAVRFVVSARCTEHSLLFCPARVATFLSVTVRRFFHPPTFLIFLVSVLMTHFLRPCLAECTSGSQQRHPPNRIFDPWIDPSSRPALFSWSLSFCNRSHALSSFASVSLSLSSHGNQSVIWVPFAWDFKITKSEVWHFQKLH